MMEKSLTKLELRHSKKNIILNTFLLTQIKNAAIVERFKKTLKTVMCKYFYYKGTYKCIGVLDELVFNYSNTKHSIILMKPKNVNKSNENQVWNTIFRPRYAVTPLHEYKVGDLVRIYRYKSVFTKGYQANFT